MQLWSDWDVFSGCHKCHTWNRFGSSHRHFHTCIRHKSTSWRRIHLLKRTSSWSEREESVSSNPSPRRRKNCCWPTPSEASPATSSGAELAHRLSLLACFFEATVALLGRRQSAYVLLCLLVLCKLVALFLLVAGLWLFGGFAPLIA